MEKKKVARGKKPVELKEKVEDKKEEHLENHIDEKKMGKEALWIIGVMAGLIAFILVFYFAVQSMKTFQYEGLTFTKEKFGEIPVYHYYYFFNDLEGKTYKYNLYLRNDPRKLNVTVEGPIIFTRGTTVYISINATGLTKCSDSSIAIAGLTQFLTNNMLKIKGAVPDKEQAELDNVTYASCENNPDDIVILIGKGEETKIVNEDNCYRITASDCNILRATEKFEVQTILDAKARAAYSS